MGWVKDLFVLCAMGVISSGALFLAQDATVHLET